MRPTLTHSVLIETSRGAMVVDLFGNDAPVAVQRFLAIVSSGACNGAVVDQMDHRNTVSFHAVAHTRLNQDYEAALLSHRRTTAQQQQTSGIDGDLVLEHRRQRTLGIQCLTSSSSTKSGSANTIPFHINQAGLLLASCGPSRDPSLLFQLTVTPRHLVQLESDCIVFGEVAEGKRVVADMAVGMAVVGGGDSGRPLKLLRIKHATVLGAAVRSPLGDDAILSAALRISPLLQATLVERVRSATAERQWVVAVEGRLAYNAHEAGDYLSSGEDDEISQRRGGALKRDRDSDDGDAKNVLHQQKLNQTRALMLRVLNSIPDEDVTAPETVLFVCKLNPLTDAEGLRMVFSQFGAVQSVDLIRDKKTGQSLQYGFVDFASKESCEKAFQKMDGALIDDSRIHVDFSQSVAKVWASQQQRR